MNTPAKWAIRRTVEIGKWFEEGIGDDSSRYVNPDLTNNPYLHYPNYSRSDKPFDFGSHGDSYVRDGYTEITYDQFLQFIGNQHSTYEIY